MTKKASATDGQLILKLYELRREAEMRKARHWMPVEFSPRTADDFLKVGIGFGHARKQLAGADVRLLGNRGFVRVARSTQRKLVPAAVR